MNRTELVNAMVTTFKTGIPALKDSVQPYDGRFTGVIKSKDMANISFKTPTLFVDCLGGPLTNYQGYDDTVDEDGLFDLLVAGRSIHKSRTTSRSEVTASAIVDLLKVFIPGQHWGFGTSSQFLMTPRLIDADNTVTYRLNSQGISFYSIRFNQAWRDGPAIPFKIEERS